MARSIADIVKEYVYLAEASYANLSGLIENPIGNNEKLIEYKNNYAFYEESQLDNENLLARELLDRYEVVAYHADLLPSSDFVTKPNAYPYSENSFSATLYKSRVSEPEGQYVLAMKGTFEFKKDAVDTDLSEMVAFGAAFSQIIDMYNFWQQINSPKGESYQIARANIDNELNKEYSRLLSSIGYQEAIIRKSGNNEEVNAASARLRELREDLKTFLDPLEQERKYINKGAVYKIEFVNSHDVFSKDDQRYSGLGINPDNLVVTGHSLGGHLAAAFAVLFKDKIDCPVYMVNGAGFRLSPVTGYSSVRFAENVRGFFRGMGVNPESLNALNSHGVDVTNFIADKGMDLVAQDWSIGLHQPGKDIDFFIEEAGAANLLGHGAGSMTDSALVMALFDKLTSWLPSLDGNADIAQGDDLEQCIQAYSNFLETAVGEREQSKTLEILVYALGRFLGRSKLSLPEDRIGLHEEISRVSETIDQLGIEKQSLLDVLNIDVLKAELKDDSENGVLARHALRSLTLFSLKGTALKEALFGDNGKLKDELPFLELYDPKKSPDGMTQEYMTCRLDVLCNVSPQASLESFLLCYFDHDLQSYDTDLFPWRLEFQGASVFGSLTSSTEVSSKFGDYSGDKNDYLFGGQGNDEFFGHAGDDYMEGGRGFDTYHIQDYDRVRDADLQGRLLFGEIDLTGVRFMRRGTEIWASVDEHGQCDYRFWLCRNGDDLNINQLGKGSGVKVCDFFAQAQRTLAPDNETWSGLGLKLEGLPAPQSKAVWKEDALSVAADRYSTVYASSGELRIYGGMKDDALFLSGERHMVRAGDGNDRIYGSTGADELHGEVGNDVIYGSSVALNNDPSEAVMASDADTIYGGTGRDLLFGGAGNDQLYADFAEETQTGEGDWLLGNQGADSLFGSSGNDYLGGGEGSDLIMGRDGDDVIVGDGDMRFATKTETFIPPPPTVDSTYTVVPRHPLLPPGIQPTPLTISASAASVDYTQDGENWKTLERGSFVRPHASMFAWNVAIDYTAGDYALNNILPTSAGAHRVAAGGAADFLYGGAGDDLIIGQDGDDILLGNEDNDILWGDDNRDLSICGDDTLFGGAGDDVLYGGAGDDTLYAGAGADHLHGGEGADRYYFYREDIATAQDINIIDDTGEHDSIYLDDRPIFAMNWVRVRDTPGRWKEAGGDFELHWQGARLTITRPDCAGKIIIEDFHNGTYGLELEENRAPEIVRTAAVLTLATETEFHHTFKGAYFRDPEGDEMTYSMADLPEGLRFDAQTMTISGTATTPGEYQAALIAEDGQGGTTRLPVQITVQARNHAPVAEGMLDALKATEGEAFRHEFTAALFSDADGDALTYALRGLPEGMAFDADTRTLSGTPTQPGTHILTLFASDGRGGVARHDFALTVAAQTQQNRPPALGQPLPETIELQLRQPWSLALNDRVHDADGDTLTYTLAEDAPAWLSMDEAGNLTGTPVRLEAVSTTVQVSDGRGGNLQLALRLNVTTPDGVQVKEGFHLGSFGNDIIYGGEGNDTLRALPGDDIVYGWEGDDHLVGELGDDTLYGGEGNDKLEGSIGNDVLYGEAGDDELYGQIGNDTLAGGRGNDHLHGGVGDDTYLFRRGDGDDRLREGGGNDTLEMTDFRLSELSITRDGGDIILAVANSNDRLTIENWNAWFGLGKVETIKLADATLSADELEQYADGLLKTTARAAHSLTHSMAIFTSPAASTLTSPTPENPNLYLAAGCV